MTTPERSRESAATGRLGQPPRAREEWEAL